MNPGFGGRIQWQVKPLSGAIKGITKSGTAADWIHAANLMYKTIAVIMVVCKLFLQKKKIV